MKWMQFFTPVSSINWQEAHKLIEETPGRDVVLLDVRQPKEYAHAHLPGAKLIPLGDLDKRLDELGKEQPIVIYCASGGRSRVAAQMLAGKDFSKVYNLTGGIKAWNKEVAVGPEESGLHLFTSEESPEEAVVVGFGLEVGLREFYLSMQAKTSRESTKVLFGKLADIEILHQERLVELYRDMTGSAMTMADFSKKIVEPGMEGGLSTEEYLQLYNIDYDSELEVLGMALAIEAQALDLYLRAGQRSDNQQTKKFLLQIADEERSHIARLSSYIDQQQDLT
ncbi:sulfurtransferase [Rhodopseudomonas palustris]|nr:sulfurtransferase [Rhodopseudomonas palustris]